MDVDAGPRRRAPLPGRRTVLSLALLAPLAGCATQPRYTVEEGVRRLLTLSSQRAFSRLFAANGFYDAQVARADRLRLPAVAGRLGAMIAAVMQTDAFRRRASMMLNRVAQDAADRATPIVLDTIRGLSARDALAALNGGPTAATDILRTRAGPAFLDALLPGLSRGLRADLAEMAGAALAQQTGIDYVELGQEVAGQVMDGVFDAIGREEAAIRRDPAAARDPVLAAFLSARR